MTKSSHHYLILMLLGFALFLILIPSAIEAEEDFDSFDRTRRRESIFSSSQIRVDLFVEDEDGDNFAVISKPLGETIEVFSNSNGIGTNQPTPTPTPMPTTTPEPTPTSNTPFRFISQKTFPSLFSTPTPTPMATATPTPQPTPIVIVETNSQKKVTVRVEETHETNTYESHNQGTPSILDSFFDLPSSISRKLRNLF